MEKALIKKVNSLILLIFILIMIVSTGANAHVFTDIPNNKELPKNFLNHTNHYFLNSLTNSSSLINNTVLQLNFSTLLAGNNSKGIPNLKEISGIAINSTTGTLFIVGETNNNLILLKMNLTGNFNSIQNFGNNYEYIKSMAVDKRGNTYILGDTSSNNIPMKNAFNETNSGNGDIFLMKFDSNGRLVFSTYLGGSGEELASSITVDNAGNCYITGETLSKDFPTKNAFNATYGGGWDVFLSKFDSNGKLVFSTYLGGNSDDYSVSIAIDSSGNTYVTGNTQSKNFPIKNTHKTTFGGASDVFLAKFNSTGDLIFSTYIGGSGDDSGSNIAVDNAGNSYITGTTYSSNFPMKNAFNATFGGQGGISPASDEFLAKFNSTGDLIFSTYLGIIYPDQTSAIVVDSAGNSYITGTISSKNFSTKNAFDTTFGGVNDAFLNKFNSTGSLVFSSYLGGNGLDSGSFLTIDSSDHIYVIGQTNSDNFPLKNASQPIFENYQNDFFVSKFDSNDSLVFSTYLGNSNYNFGYKVLTDSAGNCYITGTTYSNSFPIKNAYQSSYGGKGDVFLTKFNSTGSLNFSTYLGGNNLDSVGGFALDPAGNIYITGSTESNNFPTKNAFNATYGGNGDIFLAKFDPNGKLAFSTYLGGTSFDSATGIAVDKNGNVFITGTTYSSKFPTKNAFEPTYGGYQDVFVTKFDSIGKLVFSTFLGGSSRELDPSIALDRADFVYIAGKTQSKNFPIQNAFDPKFGGITDIFLTKLDSYGGLIFSTYLGGNSEDNFSSLVVDSNGDSYITGTTYSTNFQIKNALNITDIGVADYFLTKFNTNGDLVFSTYLGESSDNCAPKIAIDSGGNSYLTGITYSSYFLTKNDFNATRKSGFGDILLTKFNSNGNLVSSTYLVGNSSEYVSSIAVDSEGNSYITGTTYSRDFKTKNAYNATYGGNGDVFLCKFDPTGALVFSTFIGGSFLDSATGIAVGSNSNKYIIGFTYSSNFPTKHAFKNNFSGSIDIFIIKFNDSLIPEKYFGPSSILNNLIVIFIVSILLVFSLLLIYLFIEYRKDYREKHKTKPNKFLSFKAFLKNKFSSKFKPKKQPPKVSDKTFEIMDKIEKENSDKD